jgi:hypothetical protein
MFLYYYTPSKSLLRIWGEHGDQESEEGERLHFNSAPLAFPFRLPSRFNSCRPVALVFILHGELPLEIEGSTLATMKITAAARIR